DQFVAEGDGVIYLDGNSLGRLPGATVARLRTAVEEEWGKGLVRSWSHWVDLPAVIGDRIGETIIGAGAGQVIVADSTTVNLYKAVAAVMEASADRRTVVTDAGNFPTDRYVLEGLCRRAGRELRLIETDPIDGVQIADLDSATAAGDVALVV